MCDNIYKNIANIFNITYRQLTVYIPEHTIQITSFNTKTNKIQPLFPLLCLFKYYRIPRKLHEIYYSITVWSSIENKYVSLFIDGLILSELETKYNINPYTIPNILGLLRHTNNIKYIHISNTKNDITYYFNTYIQRTTLVKYYNSLAIPNNVTVHALHLLYLYLNNCHAIDLLDYQNTTVKITHNNNYETIFVDKNAVVFLSLDVNTID